MPTKEKTLNMEQLMDRVEQAAAGKRTVVLGELLEAVGSRSFGVLLLLAGVIILTPLIGDIPGVPSLMALLVVLTGVQILFGRHHFWLPEWLLKRSIAGQKVIKTLDWMRRPARFVDRWLRPRLGMVVEDLGLFVIAAFCIAIALLTPVMELVPFSANLAGAALTAFGLSLTARDGMMALWAYLFAAITFGVLLHLFV
jgi:hypothetical protein